MDILTNKKVIIPVSFFIILISIFFIYYFYNDEDTNEVALIDLEPTTEEKTNSLKFYIDIKGSIKKPGVYLVEEGMIVNDAIKLAGGLKTGAITSNINLSQKLTSEMVIYIFNKKDFTTKEIGEVKTDVICTTNIIDVTTPTITNEIKTSNETTSIASQNSKVNINTASKEELMTLSNIGASKADAIIIYRNENKFKTIEEIMNVAGIGESVYAKIKDSITV